MRLLLTYHARSNCQLPQSNSSFELEREGKGAWGLCIPGLAAPLASWLCLFVPVSVLPPGSPMLSPTISWSPPPCRAQQVSRPTTPQDPRVGLLAVPAGEIKAKVSRV